MVAERSAERTSGVGRRDRRSKGRRQTRLAQIVERLETRTMLSVAPLEVEPVLWNGQMIDAVRDEYVFRMPQLNAARAKSPVDFVNRTPSTPNGWDVDPLGLGFYRLSAPGATQQTVVSWAQRQMVRYIEPNAIRQAAATPDDPLYAAPENWGFTAIEAEEAWDTSTGVASNVVAVLDTGVDYTHPDLADNMWQDPVTGDFGFNAITGGNNPMDDNGHGTFAAGIIGAVGDNGTGLAGVNWTVEMMAVKVLGANGIGTAANVVAGVNYVTTQKIAGQAVSTVHCGFARDDFSQAELDALQSLGSTGVVIVCAAGNEGNDNDFDPRYPANYEIPSLISVAASDENDEMPLFSNFGATTVDLAAPGVAVLSTRAEDASPLFGDYAGDDDYTVGSGTSFSSAFVAGAAALLKAVKPTASATQIRNAILEGVDEIPALDGLVATGGRLNLANSVDIILSSDGLPVASFKTGQVTRVVEGDKGYSFIDVTVVLDRPPAPGKTAVVAYETRAGGSAFQGVDFVRQAGTVTFSGSQTERSFRLRIIADRVPEPDEQFAVQLVPERSRDVSVEDLVQQNLTIVDDDFETQPTIPTPTEILVPRVRITPLVDERGERIPVVEGEAAQFVVFLDRVSNQPVTVRYRTHEPAVKPIEFATAGRDYLASMGTVTFRPGETRKVISVKTLADSQLEVIDPVTNRQLIDPDGNPLPEIFNVLLYDPVNAVLSGAESVGVAEILDRLPDPPAPPPGAGGFTITLAFADGVTDSVIAASTTAAQRWEQVIVGDLPDVIDPNTGEVIDDILIDVQMGLLGGAPNGPGGALANAGPRAFRNNGQGLPYLGAVGVDPFDADRAGLVDVMIHEFAHALGFTRAASFQGFVTGTSFTGPNAVREYEAIFGAAADPAGVPLETGGGMGTAGGHWSEDVFGNELMTGFLNPGDNPLSRVTVGAFDDMGYTVDYAAADAYTPPAVRLPLGIPLAPIVVLPPSRTPPISTRPIGSTPVLPPVIEPVVVRPPVSSAPVSRTPVTRTPVTRTPVTRTPAVGQPISGTPVSRLPATRQPLTRG